MVNSTKHHASLSRRQKSIIQLLIQMNAKPLTVSAISEKIGVSSRTILREMPVIEKWMTDNDFHFVRKPGVGLSIAENPENLQLIRELLDVEQILPMYSRQERRRQILGELFFSPEPIKAYSFTSSYHISEGTLYEDLDALDLWLSDYQLSITRKPGVGIFLPGNEAALRQAISNAVFEFCDVDKLFGDHAAPLSDFTGTEGVDQIPLLVFFEYSIVRFSGRLLAETQTTLNVRYTDSGFISLIIRLSLAIYRIQMGRTLTQPVQTPEHLSNMTEHSIAKHIADEIQKEFSLTVSEYEIGYITMHLSSARIWSRASEIVDPLQNMNVLQMVTSMTAIVEQLTDIPFRSDDTLIDDLVRHIEPMAKRISMDLIIENSHTNAVRQSYPDIYSAVETSCQVLREWLAPKELLEADIGFIAMHFAAAAERIQTSEQKIAVAVVCPTGIGSSRMLAASLTKFFPTLEIRKVISVFSIDAQNLRREGIDFIISSMELHTDFPHLTVGKVLQVQDKLRIQNEIDSINRSRIQEKTRRISAPNLAINLSDIQLMSFLGTEIIELIQNFRITHVHSVENFEQMINWASYLFAKDPDSKRKIANAFRMREEVADTYIPDLKICLFHCRTSAVKHSRFGYLRLECPLETEKGTILGAVIMVAPDTFTDEVYMQPVGRLSALLIEEPQFLQALQNGNTTAGVAFAENALVKYYQNEIANQIRGGIK